MHENPYLSQQAKTLRPVVSMASQQDSSSGRPSSIDETTAQTPLQHDPLDHDSQESSNANGQSKPEGVLDGNEKLTHSETHHDEKLTTTKAVHSVALAQATALQKPSLLTKSMFLVGGFLPLHINELLLIHIALRMSPCCDIQFLHQWIRWFSHGSYQQLPSVPDLLRFPP